MRGVVFTRSQQGVLVGSLLVGMTCMVNPLLKRGQAVIISIPIYMRAYKHIRAKSKPWTVITICKPIFDRPGMELRKEGVEEEEMVDADGERSCG